MARPTTTPHRVVLTLIAVVVLLVACGNGSNQSGEVSATLPGVTTSEPPNTESTPTTAPSTTPPPATTAPPPAGGPGPGSSGCRITAGDVVTITLTDPMPGPDYCLEIRQSQSLQVDNATTDFATLSIYQGSADNLFETPELAPGGTFASEAVGEAFSSGEWSLEVSTIPGWLGTLFVVSG